MSLRVVAFHFLVVGWLILALVSGCGGDGGGGPGPVITVAKANPSGDAQTGTVAEPLAEPLRVVVSEDGAPRSGTTVTWTAAGGGTVSPTSVATGADGIASTQWTLGQAAGEQTAQAAVAGASGSPVSFTATVLAGPAAELEGSGGDNQSGDAGSELATALQVRASDAFGNPVAGVAVTWTVTEGDGAINPPANATGAAGTAAATLTLGATPGINTVEAASAGLSGSPVIFTASGTPAPAVVVSVENNLFDQASVTIAAGDVVRWNWVPNAVLHNLVPVAPNNLPDQPVLRNGPFTYQAQFPTAGTYKYYCSNHGAVDGAGNTSGMAGEVIVQ